MIWYVIKLDTHLPIRGLLKQQILLRITKNKQHQLKNTIRINLQLLTLISLLCPTAERRPALISSNNY